MTEYINFHQLNIILILSGMSFTIVIFSLITKAMSKKKRLALIILELSTIILINADRFAMIYNGNPGKKAYYMVRICNFLVFSMTLFVIYAFNIYLIDLLREGSGERFVPKRLSIVKLLLLIGLALIIISQFTDFYYYFDAANTYHRSYGFIVCYILPVITPVIQISVIIQNKNRINRGVYVSLILFIIVPMICSLIQAFCYGLILTDIAFIVMAAVLFIIALNDINSRIERANRLEIENLTERRRSAKRLFKQTAIAFINAIEEREAYMRGHSLRVAKYAKEIAKAAGKNKEECEEVYYAAMLHDIGKIDIPEEILKNRDELNEAQRNIMRKHVKYGGKILKDVKDFPFLRDGALYHHERYDGKGYPEGLKGDKIPEIARIIAVANYYDGMASKKSNRGCLPQPVIRDTFRKEAGYAFNPKYVDVIISLIDKDKDYRNKDENEIYDWSKDIICKEYRSTLSKGVRISETRKEIRFECVLDKSKDGGFAAPSVILFDSYDTFVHNDAENIKSFGYMEYGELWFDGRYICTNAKDIEVKEIEKKKENKKAFTDVLSGDEYIVRMARYGDHGTIRLIGPDKISDFIIAFPNSTRYSFLCLTGENCRITDIVVDTTNETVGEYDIKKIAGSRTYTNRIEGDITNIQIDGTRTASTQGILLKNNIKFAFHTMSLPTSSLTWHCPYVIIYSSDDEKIEGLNYKEYAFIKLNGENDGRFIYSRNQIIVKKTDEFSTWDNWIRNNKDGLNCSVIIRRKGKKIITTAENAGVVIRNTTFLRDDVKDVYVALSGDQCALTDIRVSYL